jgi:hypothetical protein
MSRTHDPSVRAGEEGSCLRQRGHCERRMLRYTSLINTLYESDMFTGAVSDAQ